MNRKSILVGLNAVLVAVAMKPTRARAATRVHLVNQHWNSVTVEVRQGDNVDAEQNPLVSGSPFVISKGHEQVITSNGLDIFYRRPNDPDNPTPAGWTSWYHQTVFPDHDEDLTENL